MTLKQFPVPETETGRGENALIPPMKITEFGSCGIKMANKASTTTYWKSPYRGVDVRHLDIQFKHTEHYHATMKKKMEERDKSVKSILKNSVPHSVSASDNTAETSHRLKGRKINHSLLQTPSLVETGSICKASEKKVKFDDRYSRLSALETKYRTLCGGNRNVTNQIQTTLEEKCVRIHCDEANTDDRTLSSRMGLLNTAMTSEQTTHEHVMSRDASYNGGNACVIDQQEKYESAHCMSRIKYPQMSSSVRKYSTPNDPPQDTDNDVEGDEAWDDVQLEHSGLVGNTEEQDEVFEDGVPSTQEDNPSDAVRTIVQLSNKHKDINVSSSVKLQKCQKTLMKSKTVPDLIVRYSQSLHDIRERRRSLDDSCSKIALGRRRISGKTTVNTIGGAVVTRSHIRPLMFSRFSREPMHVPVSMESHGTYTNFCNTIKTNDIVNWLEQVKAVQSQEGPCIRAESEIKQEH